MVSVPSLRRRRRIVGSYSFAWPNETRLSESLSNLGKDALGCGLQGAVDGASTGVAVAAPSEVLGDFGDVEFACAADAEAELVGVGDLAEEDGGFDTGDTDEVVDDAFAVLGVGSGAVQVTAGDPGPGNGAFAAEVRARYRAGAPC